MNPFFITGLPRSRTAWVANWLTTGKTLCYHDRTYAPELLIDGRQIGFSGPEMVTDFDRVQAEFPQARWLLLQRNSSEAFSAFQRWGGVDLPDPKALRGWWEEREKLLSALTQRPGTMLLTMTRLDLEEPARAVWEHLQIAEPFDVERWKILGELNVQQDKQKGKQRWLGQQ